MARVLLAKPRRLSYTYSSVAPPLGILLLGAILRRAGHEVRLFDMLDTPDALQRFGALLQEFQPQVVGLSAITYEAPSLAALAREVSEHLPGVPIVVGGPHATAYPGECLEQAGASHAVVGEGDETLPELVSALVARDPAAADVPGVVTRAADGQPRFAPPRPPVADLESLPLPAWDLLDVGEYGRRRSLAVVGVRPYMSVVTSRGCPYRCIYCHKVHGKSYRARSPESVLAEVREIHDRLGITDLEIHDDNFNLDRGRALAILEGLARLPWRPTLNFPNGVRSDLLDAEVIGAMRRAGTRYAGFSIETITPRLQQLIRKNLDLDRAAAAVEEAVRQRIFSMGYFMLGFPTETLAEARATVRYAASSPLHAAMFFAVTAYAGTELHERWGHLLAERAGDEAPAERHYLGPEQNLSAMSNQDLGEVYASSWRRFYLRPRRVARILRDHPDRGYLLRSSSLYALARMLPSRRPPR